MKNQFKIFIELGFVFGLICIGMISTYAQQVVFDSPVTLGKITAFPDVANPNHYYYLPNQIQLAKHANGKPQFSFIRYVKNSTINNSGALEDNGEEGGLLHALVTIQVDENDLDEARREIGRVKSGAQLRGPIIYRSGRVALISSVVNEEGEMTRKVVGLGNAPILEGSKAAVSILLTKTGAEILWATFQTTTPDISFEFEMDAKGYQAPKQVKIEANFEQIYSHRSFDGAIVKPLFVGEIKSVFEELYNTGSIKLTQIGSDENLDKLKDAAYEKLISLVFDKVGSQNGSDFSQMIPNDRQSMLERATNMLNSSRTEVKKENQRIEDRERLDEERAFKTGRNRVAAAFDSIYSARGYKENPFAGSFKKFKEGNTKPKENLPSLAIATSFVIKKIKRSGNYVVDLNKYTEESRSFSFAENIGNLNSCEDCFSRFNLDDPMNKQRNIQIRLVDFNIDDFDKYLDNVEISFRKKHQNGKVTNRNVVITSNTFNESGNNSLIQYGWNGDDNQAKWLLYEYKTRWVFSGGSTMETDWSSSENGTISLFAPLVKKEVFVELDPDFVIAENVRAAEVNLYYGSEEKSSSKINFRLSDNIMSKSSNIIIPRGTNKFRYDITYYFKGKDPLKVDKKETEFSNLYLQKLEL